MLRPIEKLTFEAFRRTLPDFAGRPVNWVPGANPPDVLCIDNDGKRIGVELAEWLNEEQMKSSKVRERMEDSFVEAIRSQEIHPPSNVGLVWLNPKSHAPLREIDAEPFRDELLALIEVINSTWEENEDSRSPQAFFHETFSSYPYLSRYLVSLRFFPRSQFDTTLGIRWIRFPNHTEAYTPQHSVDALLEIIDKKTSKYLNLHQQQSLNELYLLIYYDQAWIYNTPFYAPGFGFRDIAEIASQTVAGNHGVFQKIFLFNSLYQCQEAIELWPK